jgi:hypothetical protein
MDVAVAAPGSTVDGNKEAGRVIVLSGKSGAILRQLAGSQAGEMFGGDVTGMGDVDGDGIEDLAVSAPGASSPSVRLCGRVAAYSLKAGTRLWQRYGKDVDEHFGSALASGRDLTGDKVGDLVVSSPHVAGSSIPGGNLLSLSGFAVLNGKDGTSAGGSVGNHKYGQAVDVMPDVNGDKRAEVIVGIPMAPSEEQRKKGKELSNLGLDSGACRGVGRVEVVSGKDWKSLGEWEPTGTVKDAMSGEQAMFFGSDVATIEKGLGGKPEVLVSAPLSGRVQLFPGKAGSKPRLTVELPAKAALRVSLSVCGLADLNGDGIDDFAIEDGNIEVRSGKDGAILATISAAKCALGK